jgi:hypothetical protein
MEYGGAAVASAMRERAARSTRIAQRLNRVFEFREWDIILSEIVNKEMLQLSITAFAKLSYIGDQLFTIKLIKLYK